MAGDEGVSIERTSLEEKVAGFFQRHIMELSSGSTFSSPQHPPSTTTPASQVYQQQQHQQQYSKELVTVSHLQKLMKQRGRHGSLDSASFGSILNGSATPGRLSDSMAAISQQKRQIVSSDLYSQLTAMSITNGDRTKTDSTPLNLTGVRRYSDLVVATGLTCSRCGAEFPNIHSLAGHQVMVHKVGLPDNGGDQYQQHITKRQRVISEPLSQDAIVLQKLREVAALEEVIRAQELNSSRPTEADTMAEVTQRLLGGNRSKLLRPTHSRTPSNSSLMMESPQSPASSQSGDVTMDAISKSRDTAVSHKLQSRGQESCLPPVPVSFKYRTRSDGSAVSTGSPDIEDGSRPSRSGLHSVPSDLVRQLQRLSATSDVNSGRLSRMSSAPCVELIRMTKPLSRTSSLTEKSPPAEVAAAAEAWLAAQGGISVSQAVPETELDLTLHL